MFSVALTYIKMWDFYFMNKIIPVKSYRLFCECIWYWGALRATLVIEPSILVEGDLA
jgi:hypothetical protein